MQVICPVVCQWNQIHLLVRFVNLRALFCHRSSERKSVPPCCCCDQRNHTPMTITHNNPHRHMQRHNEAHGYTHTSMRMYKCVKVQETDMSTVHVHSRGLMGQTLWLTFKHANRISLSFDVLWTQHTHLHRLTHTRNGKSCTPKSNRGVSYQMKLPWHLK